MLPSLIIGALLGWLIHEIAYAPLGWEGPDGFHFGPEPVRWGV